ncbi:MAG: response regulator [Acidobacteria bacterium]|nr:response regulator [Acidobacteriota bacterium]MCI0621040.1 response regulator [Acidobacteriota bacterium]MCI0724093.1 response regulator [Acidobacteriota bacterium]
MESPTQSEPLNMTMTMPASDDSAAETHRLLIVDDDHDVRRALVEVLRTGGYECDQAGSAAEALLYLQQQAYTCVLTDLIMPERSGLDLLRDIVSTHPDIAVILVSGQNDTAQVRRALKSGAYDYLVKPSTAGEIVTTVHAALKKRKHYIKEQTDRQSLRERVEIGMVESILFEDIVRSTIDGIMITDLENRIIMVNPAYEQLTGFLRQELMGTIPEILKGTRSSLDFGRRVAYDLASTGCWSGEVIDRRKDGSEWFANLTISRVKDSRGKAFADVFVVRDITDKKNLEQQLIDRLLEVQSAQDAAIIGFAKLAECRNPETGVHLERMREYCRVLAEHMAQLPPYRTQVDERYIDALYKSSPLHDVGKVGIPDSILLKPGKLTHEEYEIMKTHTIIGGDALKAAESKLPGRSFLTLGKEIAYHHHEKFDGSGYPFGLSGESIPLCARIVAFADAYDALTSKRVYKDMVSPDESKRRLLTDRGKHFDPEVVDAFLTREADFLKILNEFTMEA